MEISDGNGSQNSGSEDLEESNNDYINSRIAKLGFKPQKEAQFNKLLPYSETLDDDSQVLLQTIKINLARGVLLKEVEPACADWCHRLTRYIQMFGLKFSKEDHITLVKLLYELVTLPKLEPILILKFANPLVILLKKRELLSREDLVLPWRPLYDVFDYLMRKSNSNLGMYHFSPAVEATLLDLCSCASVYFDVTSTKEMLDLWRPRLCPFSSGITDTVEYLDHFLPTLQHPHETSLGYELWFNEFMDLWRTCHNSISWEPSMLNLMARLASDNVGKINWEPHMPLMYVRIMRSFNLPVNYKKMKINKNHKLSITSISVWIVSTLGGNSSSQNFLSRLMKVLESYFHPANSGTWVCRLRDFLKKLPFYFIQRLSQEKSIFEPVRRLSRQQNPNLKTFMRNYKSGERRNKKSWLPETPADSRLTDEDVTRFVESMAPTVGLAMYSRVASEISLSLQYLACMRPRLVIPPIIESMYNTLDSLTEPHKYTAAMLSLVSVARPMMESNDYKEGATHVIPLLIRVLPGIDPNDIRKCFITFQVITTFTTMFPIVDSSRASEYWKDLTEEEEVVCADSSQLEDFVLTFMERCFDLVDTSVLESTRLEQSDPNKQQRSLLENMAENAIASSFNCILVQTSPQIFKSALRKLYTFVTSRIFETTVSGKCIASICKSFAKTHPKETLKLLVPHFCNMIVTHAEHEDITEEETLDNELLYNLLLLSEVVQNGKEVMKYREMLEKVLDLTLHLKCLQGYTLACKLLTNIMNTIATTRPLECKSSNEDYSKPISEYLPVRDWAKPYMSSEVEMEWYTPGPEGVAYANHLIEKFLVPELKTITAHTSGTQELTREELLCSLSIIQSLLGCGRILPFWDDEPILDEAESCSDRVHFYLKSLYTVRVTMPDGSNVRKAINAVITELQSKLLETAEDDTKSLSSIANIWASLLMNWTPSFDEFERQTKSLILGKKIFENKLLGRRRHIRPILVNQAFHQHEGMSVCTQWWHTQTHIDITHRLIELATSRYSEVRKIAQGKLNTSLKLFLNDTIVEKLIDILKQDSNIHHEKFKGALYVLLGPKEFPLVTRRRWRWLIELWPALIRAQPSEKPSVINLLNTISDTVTKLFPTVCIDLEMGDLGENHAKALWTSITPAPTENVPSSDEITAAKKKLADKVAKTKDGYLELLNNLQDCTHSNLHWRHQLLALGFVRDLVHPDCDYPPQVVQNILNTLLHDNIDFRKIAIKCTLFVLKQQKRPHKYRTKSIDSSTKNYVEGSAVYGERDDNQWLQYNPSTAPKSKEAWNEARFSHSQSVGYYAWDKEVSVCGEDHEQPELDRSSDQMSAGEREVFHFFSDPLKLDKLIQFFSLEEKKGKDKFNGIKFILFKNLFRNHGDAFVDLFKPHLERLIADKQESNQRCAAEIITGMIRGSKHWPYEKVEKLWEYLIPLLRNAFSNMTVETVNDWSVLAATASENRDPNRHHWFLEFLMEDPLREESSFIDCGRLSALQGAINQQEWRVSELFRRLLEYLMPKLSHPYQLLRERLGSVLTNIFAPDLPTVGQRRTRGPHLSEFIATVMPQLYCLYSLSDTTTNAVASVSGSNESNESKMDVDIPNSSNSDLDEETKNSSICLLKTLVKWITTSLVRADYSSVPEFFAFFPLACMFENYEADDEVNKICSAMLAALSQSIVLPEFVPTALQAIQEVSEMNSWSARATCLDFLQVFVFHNMATISAQESWATQVNSLVLRLLKDDRVEVREKAGQVLSGLIHCDFVGDRHQLMNELKRLAGKKKKSGGNDISKRHAGVLGLCSFISAYPYDVVDPVPEIFLLLGFHLNDPQPIPTSIRKTLGDFKRTHQDNWEQHKLKFTEEQLAVLEDLNVPPSYYA